MAEIDLKSVFLMILRKWWLIFLFVVLAGAAAYLRNEYLLVPVYEASTTLYVGKNSEKEGLATSDLALGTALLADYREIARSRLVASAVIESLGLKNRSASALASSISVTQRESTRVIQIRYQDTDPYRAMDITNKVAEVFQDKVREIIQVEIVQVIDPAVLPSRPVSPNKMNNIIKFVAVAFALSLGLIFLMDYLDVTLKTVEDVQTHIGLPVLGTIPVISQKKSRRRN